MQTPLTSVEEWALTTKTAHAQHQLMLLLFLKCGLTLHELSTIKVRDVDLQTNRLTIQAAHTKNRKTRTISIPEELALACQEHLSHRRTTAPAYLFSSRQSRKVSERRIQQIIQRLGRIIIKREISPQTLRTTYITNALNNHTSLEELKEMLGIDNMQQYLYTYYAQRRP